MTQPVPGLSGSERETPGNLTRFLAGRATASGWLDRPAFTTGQTHGEVYAAAARAAGVLHEWGVRPRWRSWVRARRCGPSSCPGPGPFRTQSSNRPC